MSEKKLFRSNECKEFYTQFFPLSACFYFFLSIKHYPLYIFFISFFFFFYVYERKKFRFIAQRKWGYIMEKKENELNEKTHLPDASLYFFL